MKFVPVRVYYESGAQHYPLGAELLARYSNLEIPAIEIADHNRVPELRDLPDREFPRLKKYLILGIRKTTRLIPNTRSADFIVPFTSSGCTAMCLYCYLVCTFFKGSYLRIFVNREDMMARVRKNAGHSDAPRLYEIGSNSDMVFENTITGNLCWAIEEFARIPNARCTLATKFADVDGILEADHRGHTQIRISVNPPEIIRKVEIGTAPLEQRIEAANRLYSAGYRVGINLAPIILWEGWQDQYSGLLKRLRRDLDPALAEDTFFELIFMTYGYANDIINREALPNAAQLLDRDRMRPKGRGKFCYRPEVWDDGARFIQSLVHQWFPKAEIRYIV